MSAVFIDQTLLDALSRQAVAAPRGRKNHNFHAADTDASHRLLNAIEPGSYVAPHRHLDPAKDETMVVLRGVLGVVLFDDEGIITQTAQLMPDGGAVGVNLPHGGWHSVVGLVPGTVFFESKAGPYAPLTEAERAPWAPAEKAPEAAAFQARLAALFSDVSRA